MLAKYLSLLVCFFLGMLCDRAVIMYFPYTPHAETNQHTITATLPRAFQPEKIANNDKNPQESISTSRPTNNIAERKRFNVITVSEGPQPDDEWGSILYQSDDIDLKIAAINNLVSDDAVESLAIGLGDNSPYVRQKTLVGLGIINSETSIRMVGQTLFSDPSTENRIVAITILEKNFDMPFVDELLTYTMNHDQDELVRERAANSLGL